MKVEVNLYENGSWKKELDNSLDSPNTLITVFSASDFQKNELGFKELCEQFPNSIITGCSTTGEIYENKLYDGTLSIAIAKFEKSEIISQSIEVNGMEESFSKGDELARKFDQKNLKSLFVLSDGLAVHGSELLNGLNKVLNKDIMITGGMASDNGEFEKTWVFVDRKPLSNHVTAIGFYGDNINVDSASEGGWNRFGVERLVTSCDSTTNTIYTVDNKPMLELYKNYMGEEHAKNLPTSGLKFPLLVIDEEEDSKIRLIIASDEEKKSVTVFADIKEGNRIVFLKGSSNYIISGAQKAARNLNYDSKTPTLSLTVSCMARRAVLKDRTEDEIEVVKEALTDNVSQIGFYSYGEFSPRASGKCTLLNQTMTLALIWES